MYASQLYAKPEFQFLVVRLKGVLTSAVEVVSGFQFLVVRLKDSEDDREDAETLISIPCGSIKRDLMP